MSDGSTPLGIILVWAGPEFGSSPVARLIWKVPTASLFPFSQLDFLKWHHLLLEPHSLSFPDNSAARTQPAHAESGHSCETQFKLEVRRGGWACLLFSFTGLSVDVSSPLAASKLFRSMELRQIFGESKDLWHSQGF